MNISVEGNVVYLVTRAFCLQLGFRQDLDRTSDPYDTANFLTFWFKQLN